MIPDVGDSGRSLVIGGVGTGGLDPLWLFLWKIGAFGFELAFGFGPEDAEEGVIFDNIEDAAGFQEVGDCFCPGFKVGKPV